MESLDPALLSLLACPACKDALSFEPENARLSCAACRKFYPVKDGIPDLV